MVPLDGLRREEVLLAAIAVRDEYLASKGQLSLLQSIPHIKPIGRNNTLAGVTLNVAERSLGQQPSAYFRVTFKDENGEFQRKCFGIRKHGGYIAAFRKAVKFRLKASNLAVNVLDVPLLRPTTDQFVLIMNLAGDVPVPENTKPKTKRPFPDDLA